MAGENVRRTTVRHPFKVGDQVESLKGGYISGQGTYEPKQVATVVETFICRGGSVEMIVTFQGVRLQTPAAGWQKHFAPYFR